MTSIATKIENTLTRAAQGAAIFSYPTSWEKMDIDENKSLWASYTPDYKPGPPLAGDTTADLAIIGGGFTGVSTAYHFAKRHPEKRVILLEAKGLANGASGRNGGMMLNWVYGMGEMDDDTTKRIYENTLQTIDTIESIIEEHNLDVSYRRDGCMEVFTDQQRADEAEAEVEYLKKLGLPIEYLAADGVHGNIDLKGTKGALFDKTEGQLNGAQYLRALRPVLQEMGVEIYEQTPVLKVKEGSTVELTTPNGRVRAKAIVLALNGYTGKLGYFRKDYFPLHSHVFATDRLTDEQVAKLGWRGTAGFSDDLMRISYATRTRENNIVFGGGSNISYAYQFNNKTAFQGNATAGFSDMLNTMNQYMPGSNQLPISHKWTGTLAITLKRNCAMGVRGDHKNVYYALGYSGHGLTAANMAGEVLNDIYDGSIERWRGLPFMQSDFAKIPLEPFRWMGYQMMTRLTGRSPRAAHR
ncbi:MAG: NAD(P)/FAD-dependent oxidoreductase [Anaerolineae bacterium]